MLVGEPPQTRRLRNKFGLLTKWWFDKYQKPQGDKKDASWRQAPYFISLLRFKAVAERRQWSSAASIPRRKTRVKSCPHF